MRCRPGPRSAPFSPDVTRLPQDGQENGTSPRISTPVAHLPGVLERLMKIFWRRCCSLSCCLHGRRDTATGQNDRAGSCRPLPALCQPTGERAPSTSAASSSAPSVSAPSVSATSVAPLRLRRVGRKNGLALESTLGSTWALYPLLSGKPCVASGKLVVGCRGFPLPVLRWGFCHSLRFDILLAVCCHFGFDHWPGRLVCRLTPPEVSQRP